MHMRKIRYWLMGSIITAAVAVQALPLPQDHEYQRVLRGFMATLTENDFEHGKGEKPRLTTPADTRDAEAQYRSLMLNQMIPPMIGSKRGSPSVNFPPSRFTLPEIEASEKSVLRPGIDADSLMSFVSWDYPGNILYNSRALKLRSFVASAIQMMMVDQYFEANPTHGRADWHAYQLVYFGFAYAGFKDLLPAEVQAAYTTGMERYARRILAWGIKGEEPNMDLIAAASLWYAYDASADEALRSAIEEHIKTIFTDSRYFHPAGYWVERGGVDIGFAGMANYFAVWSALKSNRDYANDAVARIYRLRAHLTLTEPNGDKVGPTHFNSRLGSDPHEDQWSWGNARDYAASQVTDEAAHLVRPTPGAIAEASPNRASSSFNGQIQENISRPGTSNDFMDNHEIQNSPWQLRMWYNWNFPVTLNPGYDHYRPGSWARRQALERANSPMLKSPFERGEHFIHDFAQAFFVSHQEGYTAILHTGPIGRPAAPEEGRHDFHGPMGLGGGQLSAFSTPAAGAVLLGRRGGQNWDKTFDLVEEWRLWPIHAVSGETTAGTVFTSARITDPSVQPCLDKGEAIVTVSGIIPAEQLKQAQSLAGQLDYRRTFTLDKGSVKVTTHLKGDGKDTLAELYETLPVFHRRDGRQADGPKATITFQVGNAWREATAEAVKQVSAVRLARFNGVVEIRFDRPRTVRLSAADWQDSHMSRALCRNILIDLLETDGKPATVTDDRSVSYTIQPVQL